MNYLLDTNLLLIYNRGNQISRLIEDDYHLFSGKHNLAVSVVAIGEIKSILYQAGVGQRRTELLNQRLDKLVKLSIDHREIINKYIEIDAFSQGRHQTLSATFSPRNRGKNDLWIAATASALNLKLVTTDKDFEHLQGKFLDLEYVDFEEYRILVRSKSEDQ